MINFIAIRCKKLANERYLATLVNSLKESIKYKNFNVKYDSSKDAKIEITLSNNLVYQIYFKIETYQEAHLTVRINVYHPLKGKRQTTKWIVFKLTP